MTGKRWEKVSQQAKDLVVSLLNANQEQRPTAVEALQHAWFTMTDATDMPALGVTQIKLRTYAQQHLLPMRLYRDGETLIHQGELSREVFLIRSGVVDVSVEDKFCGADGPVSFIPLGQCVEGEYIGEFSMLSDKPIRDSMDVQRTLPRAPASWRDDLGGAPPCPITVKACGDVEVLVFTREQLRSILNHDKGMNLVVLREAEERLALLERKWREALETSVCKLPARASRSSSGAGALGGFGSSGVAQPGSSGVVTPAVSGPGKQAGAAPAPAAGDGAEGSSWNAVDPQTWAADAGS